MDRPLSPGEFSHLLEGMDTAFLCTNSGPRITARPMRVVSVEENCDVIFLSSFSSPKMEELARNHEVCLTFQSGDRYAVLSGRATASNEIQEIEAIWSEGFRPWFPEGPSSTDLALIRVTPRTGESWDVSGMNKLRFLIEAGKAYLKGEEISDSAYEHERMREQRLEPIGAQA